MVIEYHRHPLSVVHVLFGWAGAALWVRILHYVVIVFHHHIYHCLWAAYNRLHDQLVTIYLESEYFENIIFIASAKPWQSSFYRSWPITLIPFKLSTANTVER